MKANAQCISGVQAVSGKIAAGDICLIGICGIYSHRVGAGGFFTLDKQEGKIAGGIHVQSGSFPARHKAVVMVRHNHRFLIAEGFHIPEIRLFIVSHRNPMAAYSGIG